MALSFEDLYNEDKREAFATFSVWINDFIEGFGADAITVDRDRAFQFLTNLRKEEFPAQGGFERASPFKKAANIYIYLHVCAPFVSSLPKEVVGEHLAQFPTTITTLIGFSIVQDCLHGATLYKDGGEAEVIKNPIDVSKHFFTDLVEASRGLTPVDHFKTYSLLFESLTYEANEGSSYPKCFGIEISPEGVI